MNPKWLWPLLAVSVTFNVFFAIGYGRSRAEGVGRARFEDRARRFVKRLDLNDTQQEAFEQILAQTVQQRQRIRQVIRPQREALWAELTKDQPDDEALRRFVQSDIHLAKRKLMVEQMKRFMAVLTPQQRRMFVESIRARAQMR